VCSSDLDARVAAKGKTALADPTAGRPASSDDVDDRPFRSAERTRSREPKESKMLTRTRQPIFEVLGLSTGASTGIANLAGRLFTALRETCGSIVSELTVRRDIGQLSELEDHMLLDIGLARRDIETYVREGRSDPFGR